MGDTLSALRSWAASYIVSCGKLLVTPQKFLLELDYQVPRSLTDSLTFYAASFAASGAFHSLFVNSRGFDWRQVLVAGVLITIQGAIEVTTQRLAWLSVGGNATWKELAIANCYVRGFTVLGLGFLKFILDGINENVAALLTHNGYHSILQQATKTFSITAIIFFYGYLVITWGIFRRLNRVNRSRSVGAFVVYVCLSIATLPIAISISLAFGLRHWPTPPTISNSIRI